MPEDITVKDANGDVVYRIDVRRAFLHRMVDAFARAMNNEIDVGRLTPEELQALEDALAATLPPAPPEEP